MVCQRCREKIEWKKKYRKYKPLTAPAKCEKCGNRTVKAAYHHLCDDCARVLFCIFGCNKIDIKDMCNVYATLGGTRTCQRSILRR